MNPDIMNDLLTLPGILIALAAIIALFYGLRLVAQPSSPTRTTVKTLPVAILALAALLSGQGLLVAAFILCAIGDALLADDGENRFLAGLASFLLGHLVFAYFFFSHMPKARLTDTENLVTALLLVSLMVLVNLRLWPYTGTLRIPVIFYSLAIGAMVLTAKASDAPQLALLGVVMFMVSDIVLAREKFLPEGRNWADRNSKFLVWYLYAFGQAAIAWGILFGGYLY